MRVDSPPVTNGSYSVAQIPAVPDALANGKRRGMQINLIFESPEHFDDAGGSHFYASYHWSFEQRPAPRALLHAESVIVDGHDTFVTSANLSNLAYQSSLELHECLGRLSARDTSLGSDR